MRTATQKDMARIVIEVPRETHRTLKMLAAYEGKTLKHYFLEKTLPQKNKKIVMDESNINYQIAMGIREVEANLAGDKSSRSARDFFNSLSKL